MCIYYHILSCTILYYRILSYVIQITADMCRHKHCLDSTSAFCLAQRLSGQHTCCLDNVICRSGRCARTDRWLNLMRFVCV